MRLWKVLAAWLALTVPAAGSGYRFSNLSVEQGLSQSTVQAITQDHLGFIWLGTEEGLNRFDGHSFAVFKHDPDDVRSIPHDRIFALYEDRQQRLWIGTEAGLGLYDRRTETFTRVAPIRQRVNGVVEDGDGTLWFATEGEGLYERNPATGTFVLHHANPDDTRSLSSNRVSTVLRDRAGRVWVGTRDAGLERLEREGRKFIHYRHDERDPESLSHDEIWDLAEDREGLIWVATYGGGLSVLDPRTGRFRRHRHRPGDPTALRIDLLTSVLVDRSGFVWIGTDGEGVQRFDGEGRFTALSTDSHRSLPTGEVVRTLFEDVQGQLWVGAHLDGASVMKRPRGFGYFTHSPADPTSLSDPRVMSFLEDREGRIWVGTDLGWLNLFDRASGRFTRYRVPSATPRGSGVLALHQDRRGRIWAGVYRSGLCQFDPRAGTFQVHRNRPGDPRSLVNDEVWAITEDDEGFLWIGTNAGLDRFDPERGIVTQHLETPAVQGLSYTGVRALLLDGQKNLWVGTFGGLNVRLRGGGGFVRYTHDQHDPFSLSNNGVVSLHEDSQARLWVGTYGGGLNRLDAVARRFVRYRGFPSNVIHRIEEDDSGKLWISTNHGLSRLDPQSERRDDFDLANGLLSLRFRPGASLKTRNGRLLFGSTDGFYDFDPRDIRPDDYAPRVVFTALSLFNEPAKLPAPLSALDKVELTHRDHTFSIQFAALDYTVPRRNQYAYRLEGKSEEWISLGHRREVTLTDLDPGTYVFRVKASNSDGVWSDSSTAAMRLVIRPPLWKTWWFKLASLGALVLLALAARRLRARSLFAVGAERERALGDRQRAEEKYRSIFENAEEGIFQSTPDGRLLTVNPALARILGYDSPEAMLAEVSDIERQFYTQPSLRRTYMDLLESQGAVQGFEHQLLRRDGSTIWVSENAHIVRDEHGNALYYEGTLQDVTDRYRVREVEAALREGLEHASLEWQRTFDAIESMVVVLDEHGIVRRANRAGRQALSITTESGVGRPLVDLGPGEPWTTAADLAREVTYLADPVRGRAHDATTGRSWEITATPVMALEQAGQRVIVVAREVGPGISDPGSSG